MDVKAVAEEAIKMLESDPKIYHTLHASMLRGFFEGVIDGQITAGQSWVADLLRGDPGFCPRISEDSAKIIVRIVSSGMCGDSQSFSNERAKTFADRSI